MSSPKKEEVPGLKELSAFAAEMDELEESIAVTEAKLKEQQANLLKLMTETIPEFMDEIEIGKVQLKDGRWCAVSPLCRGHINEDNKAKAFAWLRKHKEADIIKTTLAVDMGKDVTLGATKKQVKALQKLGYTCTAKQGVHGSTLNRWVRERIEGGLKIDKDLFGVWEGQKATIK